MPLPGVTMALAILLSSARFIGPSIVLDLGGRAVPLPSRSSVLLGFQDFHARQGFALEPFEESAAGRRNIGEPAGCSRGVERRDRVAAAGDRKSTRLNSSHRTISYAVFCLKK